MYIYICVRRPAGRPAGRRMRARERVRERARARRPMTEAATEHFSAAKGPALPARSLAALPEVACTIVNVYKLLERINY